MSNPKIGVGMEVYFKSKVFDPNDFWYPHYEAYKGHKFQVVALHYGNTHVELKCISDPNVVVDGYVHSDELKRA